MTPTSNGATAAVPVLATPPGAKRVEDAFDAELRAVLEQGIAGRKGMVFHVKGATINGVVKAVRDGAVLVSNHHHGRILIRFDRIDAVEGD
jgi:hypothetical protein